MKEGAEKGVHSDFISVSFRFRLLLSSPVCFSPVSVPPCPVSNNAERKLLLSSFPPSPLFLLPLFDFPQTAQQWPP